MSNSQPDTPPVPPASTRDKKHVKSSHRCTTADGWKLHLVRTVQPHATQRRAHPVLLCPGLGSSGVYTFDLSPTISFADYLATQGWDVWTLEMRGNGLSDKPQLLGRSRWWTIDDCVDKDVPAALEYILRLTGVSTLHAMGHSMGGMILVRLLAKQDASSAMIRSCTLIGSGCFLKGSWWQTFQPIIPAARLLYSVPAGLTMRLYSNLAFTRLASSKLDMLYFWPENADPALGRAVLARNFSSISPGVILQFASSFESHGLTTADGSLPYASPELLSSVETPVLSIAGDKDRMCPPYGCRRTLELFGGKHNRYMPFGPKHGHRHHYGHFDILMGKHVEQEVFPHVHAWLLEHDSETASVAQLCRSENQHNDGHSSSNSSASTASHHQHEQQQQHAMRSKL